MKRLLIIGIALLFCHGAQAQQVTARVAGLESDSVYMKLLVQEKTLQTKEDSISRLLSQARTDLRNNPGERTQYGNRILRLESEAFDVRNQMGIVAGRINSIEQAFVISNFDKNVAPAEQPAKSSSPQPVSLGEYLRRNLSAEEMALWQQADSKEQHVVNFVKLYLTNYLAIKHLTEGYAAAATRQQADSIQAGYDSMVKVNAAISDTVATLWSYVYDNKSYLCNLLMDKADNRAYIADAQARAAQLAAARAQREGTLASDVIGNYPLEKQALLRSEQAVAQWVGDSHTADSLRKQIPAYDDMLALTKIQIQPRSFIAFEDPKIAVRNEYTAANPIPSLELYPHGTVYRIKVGNYSKAQSSSLFRNARPLCVEHTEDGRYIYYVGTIQTEEKAREALAMLQHAGFRSPEIVVWANGAQTNITARESAPVAASDVRWNVEIMSRESSLSAAVRELVGTLGEGRDISRVVAQTEDGTRYTFIVGAYDTKETADALAAAIRDKEPGLSVKVNEIAPAEE